MNRPGKCVHFRGIQHATCLAGVSMATIRDAAHRLPCLDVAAACDQRREPTAEEIAADEAAMQARLNELEANAKAGLCNDCRTKITAVEQVGRCVYAKPCGHRIGQGDAKRVAKAMGL